MKRIVYLALIILFLIFLPFATYAASDWRTPTVEELGKDETWRDEDPGRYLVVKADFDGDGKEDIARLLVSDRRDKIGLFVMVSSMKKTRPRLLESVKGKRTIKTFGIQLAKPVGTLGTSFNYSITPCKIS